MKQENQVSNLELSKKLQELNVKQVSLFCWFGYNFRDNNPTIYKLQTSEQHFIDEQYECAIEKFPAFTVAELLELCPKYTEIKKCWPSGRNPEHFYLVSNVEVRWNGNPWMTNDDNAADALAKFLIYLLENKLL